MRHNISLYDTGTKTGNYDYGRRNDGFTFGSLFGGGMFVAVPGVAMFLTGLFETGAPFGLVIAGAIMVSLYLAQLSLFATHRNFLLNARGTKVMDHIYLLPKEVRTRYNISRHEANNLSVDEANNLINAVNEYRANVVKGNVVSNGILSLTQYVQDFNDTIKELK
jgi:hypothetical protein